MQRISLVEKKKSYFSSFLRGFFNYLRKKINEDKESKDSEANSSVGVWCCIFSLVSVFFQFGQVRPNLVYKDQM